MRTFVQSRLNCLCISMFECIYLRIVVENETCDKFAAAWRAVVVGWLLAWGTRTITILKWSHFSWVASGLTANSLALTVPQLRRAEQIWSFGIARNIQTNSIKCKRFASHIVVWCQFKYKHSLDLCLWAAAAATACMHMCIARLKAGLHHTGTYLKIKAHTVCDCRALRLSAFFLVLYFQWTAYNKHMQIQSNIA